MNLQIPELEKGSHRVMLEINDGQHFAVDWSESEDEGLQIMAVWGGPVELYNTSMLQPWVQVACEDAALKDARKYSRQGELV
jgi:hypothetical protein